MAGQLVCGADGLTSDAVPGEPRPEGCDMIDDDCDGVERNMTRSRDAHSRSSGHRVTGVCGPDFAFRDNVADGSVDESAECAAGCDPNNDLLDQDQEGFVDEGFERAEFVAPIPVDTARRLPMMAAALPHRAARPGRRTGCWGCCSSGSSGACVLAEAGVEGRPELRHGTAPAGCHPARPRTAADRVIRSWPRALTAAWQGAIVPPDDDRRAH